MPDRHVRGPSRARKHARLRTKATCGPKDTGGGYERVRTSEHDPTHPSADTTVVAFAHHRLLALAWNVGHAETGDPLLPEGTTGVVDLSVLDGRDVHHDAPEADGDRGVPWDNREGTLSWVGHGEHSALTNAQQRAYAEDAKRLRDGEVSLAEGCPECGEATAARVDGEAYCLDHATERARATGETVEIL